MAGHSHWAGIKHKKGVIDARRGKLFSKLSRAIIVAARHGGADTDTNLKLRYAIDKARQASMPKDNIERAIKKGVGELDGGEFSNYYTRDTVLVASQSCVKFSPIIVIELRVSYVRFLNLEVAA